MKAVVFKPHVWENKLKPKLIEEYGVKIAISWVCKRELGFTPRYHRDHGKEEVHLDFYDEAMYTMFLLKYM